MNLINLHQNIHDHKKTSAKPGELDANDEIVFFDYLQELAQPSFVGSPDSGNGFFDPSIYGQILGFTKRIDDEALIGDVLPVSRDPDVSVNHISYNNS